jgi:hypothetical protein
MPISQLEGGNGVDMYVLSDSPDLAVTRCNSEHFAALLM